MDRQKENYGDKLMKKNKWMKAVVATLLACCIVSPIQSAVYAEVSEKPKTAEEIAALEDVASYIAIEQTSGKILMEKDQEEVRGIASMSKLISQYLILEAIKNSEITWETKIPISARANKLSANYSLSNVPLWPNETYSIRELFEASSIYSANAAVIAMAEYIAGSEAKWVERMKEKVESWGIQDATIVNATGLPNKYGTTEKNLNFGDDAENSMSARSVAIVARRLVLDFPEILNISSIATKEFRPGTDGMTKMDNFNYLVPGLLFGYEGVTGLKTGTSDLSGASITTTATRNNFSVIVVTMGSKNPLNRFKVTTKILDELFKKYEGLVVGIPGKSVQNIQSYPVNGGSDEKISVDYGDNFVAAVPKGTAMSQVKVRFEPFKELLDENNALKAPITAGKTIGELYFQMPGEDLGYVDGQTEGHIPAFAGYEINSANVVTDGYRQARGFVEKIFQGIKDFFGNIFQKVKGFLHAQEA